jgi:hypothetical protein
MRGEESETTDTNQHEAGAEGTEETKHPTLFGRLKAFASGGVLAPGTSEGSPFPGMKTTGTGTITPWWHFW